MRQKSPHKFDQKVFQDNIESDGERVWVCREGRSIGRFGRHSFDVYYQNENADGNAGRLFRDDETLTESWKAFKSVMRFVHGYVVSDKYKPSKA